MRALYIAHVARATSHLAYRFCFDVLHVKYNEVLEDGMAHAEQVGRFLGGGLDVRAMAAVVHPDLYRNRG
jgi:hypothetical protein